MRRAFPNREKESAGAPECGLHPHPGGIPWHLPVVLIRRWCSSLITIHRVEVTALHTDTLTLVTRLELLTVCRLAARLASRPCPSMLSGREEQRHTFDVGGRAPVEGTGAGIQGTQEVIAAEAEGMKGEAIGEVGRSDEDHASSDHGLIV